MPQDEEPKTPIETPAEDASSVEAPAEEISEVLPPDEEPAPQGDAPTEQPTEEPTAETYRQQLADRDAEIARLRGEKPADVSTVAPGQRVSMAQVYLKTVKPELKRQFVAGKDAEQQFEAVHEMANQMLGAVLTDRVDPLGLATVGLYNELEIRDLRSDPTFKTLEPKVRAALNKADWKERAKVEDDGTGVVTAIYHRLRGSQQNGAAKPVATTPKAPLSAPVRQALKDVSSGGGASPKPAGVRLTKEQETDFQAILQDGIDITRAEYYAKWKARADQAKAGGRKIPATYRG